MNCFQCVIFSCTGHSSTNSFYYPQCRLREDYYDGSKMKAHTHSPGVILGTGVQQWTLTLPYLTCTIVSKGKFVMFCTIMQKKTI